MDKQAHFLKTNSFLNITLILAYFYWIFSSFSQLCCWTDKQANFLRDTYSHRTSCILYFLIFQQFFGRLDKLRIPICSGTRAHLLSPEMGPSSSCCALSLSVSFDGSWEGQNIRRIFSIVVIHRYCYYLWIRAIRKWVLWRRVSQLPMLAFSEILQRCCSNDWWNCNMCLVSYHGVQMFKRLKNQTM